MRARHGAVRVHGGVCVCVLVVVVVVRRDTLSLCCAARASFPDVSLLSQSDWFSYDMRLGYTLLYGSRYGSYHKIFSKIKPIRRGDGKRS